VLKEFAYGRTMRSDIKLILLFQRNGFAVAFFTRALFTRLPWTWLFKGSNKDKN
jgi:hypothetical protein